MAFADEDGFAVWKYNVSTGVYVKAFVTPSVDGMDPNAVVLSAEDEPLLVALFNDNSNSNRWAVSAVNTSSGGQVWVHRSKNSSGELVDIASSLVVSDGGEAVAVGSWGDRQHVNPQFTVLRGWAGSGTPLLSHVTPGSVMAVALARQGASIVAVAAGFATHENLGVKGGVITAASIPLE
jgi:hypothetical protein